MNIERIKHLVTNLLTGSSSTSERTELARWINSEDAEQTSREAWKNASEKIDASLEDEMWNEIRTKIEEATPQPAPTLTIRHRSYSISRIAASIAVILCSAFASYLLYDHFTGHKDKIESNIYTFEVEPGQKGSMRLADGTIVHLNSASKISFAGNYNSEERVVTLNGEAYFEVSHDTRKPFIVRTGELTVTVLGTEFNVNTRIPTHVRTTLVEGKVQVTFKEGLPYILTPGEMASTDVFSGQTTVEQVNIQKYIAWRHGRFCFEEATIEEIMQELSLWYDLQVEYQNQKVKQEKFSGYLPRGESVMSILQKIEQTSYVHFKRVQNKIIVGY